MHNRKEEQSAAVVITSSIKKELKNGKIPSGIFRKAYLATSQEIYRN
jgi:hypothetical protein